MWWSHGKVTEAALTCVHLFLCHAYWIYWISNNVLTMIRSFLCTATAHTMCVCCGFLIHFLNLSVSHLLLFSTETAQPCETLKVIQTFWRFFVQVEDEVCVLIRKFESLIFKHCRHLPVRWWLWLWCCIFLCVFHFPALADSWARSSSSCRPGRSYQSIMSWSENLWTSKRSRYEEYERPRQTGFLLYINKNEN